MRTLIDFYEIQPRPLEGRREPRVSMVDLDVTWEEPEKGPGITAEGLWHARGWCEEG